MDRWNRMWVICCWKKKKLECWWYSHNYRMLMIQVKTGQWCRRSWSRRRSHLDIPESVTCRSKVSVFMLQFLFFSSKQPNILCYKLPVSKVVKNLLPKYGKMRKQGPMAVQKYERAALEDLSERVSPDANFFSTHQLQQWFPLEIDGRVSS